MYTEPKPFQLDGLWYSFIEYLPTSRNTFTFSKQSNRKEGIALLEAFHNSAEQISISLPSFHQLRKWQERLDLFRQNKSAISEHISDAIVQEWIAWGEWSLKGLIANQFYLNQEKNTIIHGDCAHHNFLRKKDGNIGVD